MSPRSGSVEETISQRHAAGLVPADITHPLDLAAFAIAQDWRIQRGQDRPSKNAQEIARQIIFTATVAGQKQQSEI